MENLWESYMSNYKIHPTAGIFMGKNYYGYKDSYPRSDSLSHGLKQLSRGHSPAKTTCFPYNIRFPRFGNNNLLSRRASALSARSANYSPAWRPRRAVK